MATFNDLPPELVVVHVAPYLSNVDLSSLAKTSGTLLRHLRRVRLYHLWQLYNRMYIEDAAFREEVKRWIPVDRLVLAGWNTASLRDLSAFSGVHSALLVKPTTRDSACELPMDLASLRGVHTVHLAISSSESANLSHLSDVRELRLYGEQFSDFELELPTFGKARSVELNELTTKSLRCVAGVSRVVLSACLRGDREYHKDISALRHSRSVVLGGMRYADLGALEIAHDVSILDCPGVVGLPPTTNLRSLTWHRSPLTSIPAEFGSLHFLDLSHSDKLEIVESACHVHTLILRNCYNVRDMSALRSLHTFEFSEGRIVDVSALGRVHTLRLNYIQELIGVASLDGVHDLNLAASKIVWTDDVCRALGSCHTIELSDTGIADLSAFGRVHTLRLCAAKTVKGVDVLGNCHSLDFAESNVIDVSALGRVHTLILNCTGVTDVSALANVAVLDLRLCAVEDVSRLVNVRTLLLSNTGVTDVSSLGRVHTLNLWATTVVDVSRLGAVYDLTIGSINLTDVSMLGGVHRLDLTGCVRVKDVSALGRVHTLILDGCKSVTDVSGLERVCVLSVKNCPIVDRRPLLRVRQLIE